MNILGLGDSILLRGLVFDNNQADIINGHPGVVLIPTDELDDFSYCVHCTSNAGLYNENMQRYYVSKKFKKTTYINLGHIVKGPNYVKTVLRKLNDEELYDLLKAIYNYQIENGETEEFKEIKVKIEAILEYLEAKRDNFNVTISANKLRYVDKIEPEWRRVLFFGDDCREIEGYDIKYNKMLKVKDMLRSYIFKCMANGETSIEQTESLYNYLKMFQNRDLKNKIICAIALLKEECKDEKEKKFILKIEEELEEIRAQEENQLQEDIKLQEEIREQRESAKRSKKSSLNEIEKDILISNAIERIRSCISAYTDTDSFNIELTKRLYSDFKVYYKNDFDNMLSSAIVLIQEDCRTQEEWQLIKKFA